MICAIVSGQCHPADAFLTVDDSRFSTLGDVEVTSGTHTVNTPMYLNSSPCERRIGDAASTRNVTRNGMACCESGRCKKLQRTESVGVLFLLQMGALVLHWSRCDHME